MLIALEIQLNIDLYKRISFLVTTIHTLTISDKQLIIFATIAKLYEV